ncbi:MAG TPA: molybdopterin cofactor-binding domain-containing protein [Thermoanaerobaculia bacterium]|nr:molybdopterin cofactor-binding domain-containing protein [Thermoanaerobaculia bacterium]
MSVTRINRRDFLRQAGIGTGALVFASYISPRGLLAEDIFHFSAPLDVDPDDPQKLPHFVAIEPLRGGTIVIMAHRSEMGQGIRSSLAAVLADELDADWNRVEVHQADADGPRYAIKNPVKGAAPEFVISDELAQFADSSRSMAIYYTPMRFIGAGIRLVLVRAAAERFGVKPEDCEAREHKVWYKDRSLDYGDPLLLLAAKKLGKKLKLTASDIKPYLKPSDGTKWRFIGNKDTMPFVDAKDMVTGKASYGADVALPGMLTAMIVRCPVANGTVKSYDDRAARAVPGVKFVTEVLPKGFKAGAGGVGGGFMPHAGVAVVAENTWAALQGRRALKDKIEWELGQDLAADNATYDSMAYRGELEKSTAKAGRTVRKKGDVDAVFGATPPPQTVKADYYVPHLAQAPMEPPAAVALFKDGCCEIWSTTQGPELTQHYVGLALLEPDDPVNDPVKWLAWQVLDKTKDGHYPELRFPTRECEYDPQLEFDKQLGNALALGRPGLIQLKGALKQKIRGKVKVHVTLLGGGFGRKSKPDFAIEAALLARQHPGVPIRVQWTREDDIQFSYFHSVSHQHLEAAIDGAGHVTAWLHRSAFPSFFATLFPKSPEIFAKARAAYHNGGEYPYASGIERGQGLEDMPFEVDRLQIENCPAESHIRVGWMRSVSNIFHAFAIGSFADELAHAASRDSKAYLLDLIGKGRKFTEEDLVKEAFPCFDNNGFPVGPVCLHGPDGEETVPGKDGKPVVGPDGKRALTLHSYPPDTRRLRAVIDRVATESGWDDKVKRYQGTNRGLGIAAHRSFLSYMAMVIEVSLADVEDVDGKKFKGLKVNEVWAAIDCGIAVNPDRVEAQMEGGIIYGLSLALLGEITVEKGAVVQSNFHDYPVLRLYQTPTIHTYIVPPSEQVRREMEAEDPDVPPTGGGGSAGVPPTGVGEVPVPPVAPALANAIVAAGGPRIRALPLKGKGDEDKPIRVL